MTEDLAAFARFIEDNPKDAVAQLAFADMIEECGWPESAQYVRTFGVAVAVVGAGVGAVGVAVAATDDGAVADVVGDGDAVVATDDGVAVLSSHSTRFAMEDGFYILTVQGGGYYHFCFAAWVERVDIFFRIRNYRVITDYGGRTRTQLAADGPGPLTRMWEMSDVEYLPLPGIRTIKPANPAKWAKYCPKPT